MKEGNKLDISKNIIQHDYQVSREDRKFKNNHNSFLIWFTGLSGSGKSTIANLVEQQLFEKGIKIQILFRICRYVCGIIQK